MAKKKNQSNDNSKPKNEEDSCSVTVILKIDLHCEGCTEKIVKATRSIAGVESVKRVKKEELEKITVIGKVDPVEFRQKVEEKIKKKVELISPVTKKQKVGDGEQKKQQGKDENKPINVPVTTTVLKVALHCQGCIQNIKKIVRKTEGVAEMSIDKNNDLVTVKGKMDVNMLTSAIKDKLKRNVEIVQAKDNVGGKKGKGGSGGGDGDRKESGGGGRKVEEDKIEYIFGHGQSQSQYGYPQYMYPQYMYPQYMYPQYTNEPNYTYNYMNMPAIRMFNDENPNACVVM